MKINQRGTMYARILMFVFVIVVGIMIYSFVSYAQEFNASNYQEFKDCLYKGMLNRQNTVTINYTGSDTSTLMNKLKSNEFLTDVENIDDNTTSDDGVYMMKAAYDGYKYNYKQVSNGLQVIIELTWEEDSNQLEYVNKQIETIINTTGVKNMNNAYDRAIALRDYVITNISYGKSTVNTPYTALTSKTASCHSYALLYYKLLKEADVDCYYVTGNVPEGWHAWNIVKIGGNWYNIDIAYENGYKDGSFSMKGSNSFSATHSYDATYVSSLFLNKYNISKTDFDRNNYAGGDLITRTQNQCVSKDKDASVVLDNKDNITLNTDNDKKTGSSSTTDNTQTTNKCTDLKDNDSEYDKSPKTGDTSLLIVAFIVGVVAMITCVVIVIIKKNRKYI